MSLAEDATALIDSVVSRRVLVFGSLPPAGRDVDLLARVPEAEAARRALDAGGFLAGPGGWVRFGHCSAMMVEVVPAADWNLPDDELEALFAEAVPLPGFLHLVEPAAHHQLLILARKLDGGGLLTPKRRRRAEQAAQGNPGAWAEARGGALAWSAEDALARLEQALRQDRAPSSPRSLTARRPHRPRLVSLSGIDGAGKSSQARALKHALEQLGYEAEIVWTPIAQNAWTDRLAAGIRHLLLRIPSLAPDETLRDPELERETMAGPGTMLRERSNLSTEAWTGLLALANGLSHARAALSHSGSGRVIIFDRYVLDSAVRLRVMYGESRPFRWQNRLIRLLSPPPLFSAFLDVAPETALARKQDRWTSEGLSAHARLYREQHAAFATVRIDGQAPVEEVCAQIAERVWRRLTGGAG